MQLNSEHLYLFVFCNYCHLQAEESAEQLSEELLDDLWRVAWTVRTDRQLQDMGQDRLQAPTLESMLLRMEEIQVRGTHQWKVTMELERSLVTGLVFIMSCYDSCGLRLHTDAFSRLDYTVQFVWQRSLSVGCCVYRIWFSVCLWQRDQEEVRRRFASIAYSDPLYLKQPGPAGKKKKKKPKTDNFCT